ncbi:PAS domain-containing protein [Haloterrigena sp. SYSU A558-1]|uniref:histidine kinase n=1 Tax=Haloterrigena gelatinilytica TaxID=2741724 RepID=A0ABX2LHV1_9EURY|nr:histidine kinase N-terminal 7TM domain-containing protein [Haloterrigena gelatinilytica]NUC73431.1 PAS domain-containing protein [Haloterrigena gelatinilytica]
MSLSPWLVIGSLLTGACSAFLAWYLRRHCGQPGVNWAIVTVLALAVWSVSDGVSLLVFEPTLRLVLETVSWTGMIGAGIAYLAFALDYTGRGPLVRSTGFALLSVVPAATIGLVLTNPLHGLVWSGFRLDPVFGVATVSYEFGPIAYIGLLSGILYATAGTVLVLETAVSYGPVYRTETLWVGLSAVLPCLALATWLFELGPYPQLHLTTIVFLPHLALDAYAIVASGMIELNPSTRRTAQRRAVEDLSDPVVVVNTDDRLVEYNPAAGSTFDLSEAHLGEPFETVATVDLETTPTNRLVTDHEGPESAEFTASVSELTDPSGARVGYIVVFRDVTERRQRRQQQTVMNRVLRHNLRNDLNVVSGYVDLSIEHTDDETIEAYLKRVQSDVDDVLELGEKSRALERTIEALDTSPTTVSIRPLLASLEPGERGRSRVRTDGASRLEIDVPVDLELRTHERVFRTLFANLVENGFEHNDGDSPRVAISYVGLADGMAVFEVADDGPGIPEHELAVLERGEETPLSHGSGLGLWIATWCATALGGEIEFDSGDDGTTVTVCVPAATDAASGSRRAVTRD